MSCFKLTRVETDFILVVKREELAIFVENNDGQRKKRRKHGGKKNVWTKQATEGNRKLYNKESHTISQINENEMGGECSTTGGKKLHGFEDNLKESEYLEYLNANGDILKRISNDWGWRMRTTSV